MFDDLAAFKDWWLATRVINTPDINSLVHVKDTYGVVLFRQGQYQVELFNVKPNSEIVPHVHPNVDSFEVFISGDIKFSKDGVVYEQNNLGDFLRVYPNSWHGGQFGPRGGCFISVQKWLNNVEPSFVGNDWQDKDNSQSYGLSK